MLFSPGRACIFPTLFFSIKIATIERMQANSAMLNGKPVWMNLNHTCLKFSSTPCGWLLRGRGGGGRDMALLCTASHRNEFAFLTIVSGYALILMSPVAIYILQGFGIQWMFVLTEIYIKFKNFRVSTRFAQDPNMRCRRIS